MIQKFAAKVLSFYEVRNTRVTEYLHFNFKERLETGRHRHIKEWTDVNLSPNLVIKRRETIGKK